MPAYKDPENRLARVTEVNHAAYIWIATLHSLVYAIVFLVVRVLVKIDKYGLDDIALSIAYFFALGHWIPLLVGLNFDLGKATSVTTDSQREIASKAVYASRIFLFATLTLSKISVAFLIRHIFSEKKKAYRLCGIYIVVLAILGLSSIPTITANCSPSAILEASQNEHCAHQAIRWKFVLLFDAASEIGLCLLICWLLVSLAMRKRLKFMVVLAFSFRIPVAAISLIFLFYSLRLFKSTDPAIEIAIPIVWQEALICYSLISSTIPCLRSFMKSFQTGGLVYVTSLGVLADQESSQRARSEESDRCKSTAKSA